jgi:hypothetical protein
VFGGLLLVLLIVGGVIYSQFRGTKAEDREAAEAANARGIGFLEKYDAKEYGKSGFENAAEQFATAMKLAPSWLTPKINHGMSLFFTADEKKIDQAIDVFKAILKAEPRNPYANHCLGIIYFYRSEPDAANKHFKVVTEVDPNDAYAWYFYGFTLPDREDSAAAREAFEKAVKLDPYLTTARFSLAGHAATSDPKVRAQMQDEITALRANLWERTADTKPSKLGRYGTPIGIDATAKPPLPPLPAFEPTNSARVTLEPNTTWAATVEGGAKAVRERFGGTMVRLDYDRDDKPDFLLLSAVTRNGKLADVLLHNDGGEKFTDVTTSLGLAGTASLGASAADFDNSGTTDLILTTETGVKLLRNADGKRFEDVTAAAGFDKLTGRFLAAAWLDLDQDGDLDLLLAKHEQTPGKGDGEAVVFLNVGEAPPAPPNQQLPLTVKFKRFEHPAFAVAGPVVGVVTADVENDGDVDAIVLVENQPPVVVLNDRLLRFRRGAAIHAAAGDWTGGLVFDLNGDEQSDLALLSGKAKPAVYASTADHVGNDTAGRFAASDTDSPALLQAQAIDLDHDGRTDLVGLSAERKPVLLRNDGTLKVASIVDVPDALAVAACDIDRDCHNDLVVWSAKDGLHVYRNQGTANRGFRLQLSGKRDKEAARTNHDAVGAKVTAYTGRVHTLIENTTLTAGLGQSRLPLEFGIGKTDKAHAIRIAWPDVVPQAEVDVATCATLRVPETDRRPSSCPVLFTWDGTKFRYVTDILGAGSMGELGADGSTRPPRPEESVKIEPDQLAMNNGRYVLKLAEPMDELMYLDHLRLDVVDHPAETVVFPDERFATADPQPTQQVLAFRRRLSPVATVDHRGRDVTAVLTARDGKTADGFRKRGWHGFAEEHFVELDFGNQLANLPADAPLHLVLAGWTDYAYPETIFGAAQAGVPMKPPVLEKWAAGTWQVVGDIGFPAGLPRVMTSPVTGLAGAKACRLRIRTNMHVYWDKVELAVAEPASPIHPLPVTAAKLDRRGFAKEVFPTGKSPAEYDDVILEPVAFTRWRGKLTRLGDVTELLTSLDDRFAICGPGDEVVIEFDAAKLPPVPAGHVRSFVLRSHGYCKDAAPFTATFGEVGPLPFRAMASYPDGARGKTPPHHLEYDRAWNTRPVGTR